MSVNKLDFTSINDPNKHTLEEVDADLQNWLSCENTYSRKRYVPIGFNVGTFDMAFIRKKMPLTMKVFSYHALDLNALLYTEALKTGKDPKELKSMYKSKARNKAHKLLPQYKEHNAIFDAVMAVYIIEEYNNNNK